MLELAVDQVPRCGCYAILSPDGRVVGTATQRDPHPTRGQGITNEEALERAHLFAAAPDLLAALDHPMLRQLFGGIEDSGTPEAQKLWAYAMAWFDVRDAAIAKATGSAA